MYEGFYAAIQNWLIKKYDINHKHGNWLALRLTRWDIKVEDDFFGYNDVTFSCDCCDNHVLVSKNTLIPGDFLPDVSYISLQYHDPDLFTKIEDFVNLHKHDSESHPNLD